MSDTEKATPRPWTVEMPSAWWKNHQHYRDIACCVVAPEPLLDCEGWEVCSLATGGDAEPPEPLDHEIRSRQEANARFIVQAVNSHDALVEALRACITGHDSPNWCCNGPGYRCRLDEISNTALAALKLAGVEG